jgi:hypothetical protein
MGDSNTINALLMTGLLCAGFFERAYMKGNYLFSRYAGSSSSMFRKKSGLAQRTNYGFWSRQVPYFHKGKTEIPRDIMGHIRD